MKTLQTGRAADSKQILCSTARESGALPFRFMRRITTPSAFWSTSSKRDGNVGPYFHANVGPYRCSSARPRHRAISITELVDVSMVVVVHVSNRP